LQELSKKFEFLENQFKNMTNQSIKSKNQDTNHLDKTDQEEDRSLYHETIQELHTQSSKSGDESADNDISNDVLDHLNVDQDEVLTHESILSPIHQSASSIVSQISIAYKSADQGAKKYYNTQSIHLYAIVLASSISTNPPIFKRFKCWVMALVSFVMVFTQIFIMNSLLFESSYQTCAAHTDCFSGQFCQGMSQDLFRQPRCLDCNSINSQTIFDSFQGREEKCNASPIVDNWEYDEIDENIIWFGTDFVPHINPSLKIPSEKEVFFLQCLAQEHCRDKEPAGTSDMPEFTCPHFQIMKAKVSNDQLFLFFFVLMIFASNLTRDVEESVVENAMLDNLCDIPPEDDVSANPLRPNPIALIRLSNRIRTYILPCMTAVAASSIILSESLSAKNILLNLLAVEFVTESDNLLASFFLSPKEVQSNEIWVQQVLQMNQNQDCTDRLGSRDVMFLGTRLLGISVCISMFAITLNIEILNRTITRGESCGGTNNVLSFFLKTIVPCFFIFLHWFWQLLFGPGDTKFLRLMKSLLELCRNWLAFLLSGMAETLFTYAMLYPSFAFLPVPHLILASIATIVMIAQLHSMLLQPTQNAQKNRTIVSLGVGFVWLSIQIWLLIGYIRKNT